MKFENGGNLVHPPPHKSQTFQFLPDFAEIAKAYITCFLAILTHSKAYITCFLAILTQGIWTLLTEFAKYAVDANLFWLESTNRKKIPSPWLLYSNHHGRGAKSSVWNLIMRFQTDDISSFSPNASQQSWATSSLTNTNKLLPKHTH